jgi:hypothetical protein
MNISKKKLIIIASVVFALFNILLLGTPCLKESAYSSIGNARTGYDFTNITNTTILALDITLVSSIGLLLVINFVALFIEALDEKKMFIIDFVGWIVVLAFAVTLCFSKYINISWNPFGTFIFIAIVSAFGAASSLFFYLHQQYQD